MARILYIGTAGRRLVDNYEWNEENGYVQHVEDEKMIKRLLDNGDFVIFEHDESEEPEEPEELETSEIMPAETGGKDDE